MESREITFKSVLVVVFLTAVLFLAGIDTSAIDGVVPLIQAYFSISGSETAMIRTASLAAQTTTFAAMWIFGEIVERRMLYLTSLAVWIIISLLAIVFGSQSFLVFVVLRSLAAASSSVLGVLSPVILADLFHGKALGVALVSMHALEMVSSSAIAPIYSSLVVSSGLPWQAGLLPGPVLALFPLFGMLCTMNKKVLHPHYNRWLTGIFSHKSDAFLVALAHFECMEAPEAFFGLTYPSVISLNSLLLLVGSFVGMPLLLWIAQSWHHGTGLFSCSSGNVRAYHILISIGNFVNAAGFIVIMAGLDSNYVICMIAYFIGGFGFSADSSLSKLMMLMVLPAGTRTAAMSLYLLIMGIVGIPSAQFIGFALLVSNLFMFASSLFFAVLVPFFKEDCRRAEEESEKEGRHGEVDECSTLLGKEKGRSESIMDTLIRSRATTLELFH